MEKCSFCRRDKVQLIVSSYTNVYICRACAKFAVDSFDGKHSPVHIKVD